MTPYSSPIVPWAALAGAAALSLAATPVGAQAGQGGSVPALREGARVRFEAPAGATRGGTVVAVRGDTLVLRERGAPAPSAVALASTRRLEVGRVRSRGEGAQHGALVGLLAGGVPSYGIVLLSRLEAQRHPKREEAELATLVFAVLGTALTAVTTATGAVIGYNAPGTAWERVALPPRTSFHVVPGGPGGAGVSVAVRF